MQQPLAEHVRPAHLSEFFGQEHLLQLGSPLYHTIKSGVLHSFILWGPPGSGKTTLARMLAKMVGFDFFELSAASAGSSDVRAVAMHAKKMSNQTQTVLFIDEIHRFNKSQQDILLPLVEQGTIHCIGATTENPAFALNNALLSRMQVYNLKPLSDEALKAILARAITQTDVPALDDDACSLLVSFCNGDARKALNLYQLLWQTAGDSKRLSVQFIKDNMPAAISAADNKGDIFYELISALHKSIRSSDADASLYWLSRMLQGGIDQMYIARRIVRIASEDIGNADPRALQIALNAWEAQERLGSPEGELALAQAVAYLAIAPKSNAVYTAFKKAEKLAQTYGNAPVPFAMRNAPTKVHKQFGYGELYRYDHDYQDAIVHNECMPEVVCKALAEPIYQPSDRGLESRIQEKLMRIKARKEASKVE